MLQVDPTLTRLIATRKRSLATTGLVVLLLSAMLIFSGRRFFTPTFPFISGEIWWLPVLLLLLFWLALLLSSAQEGFLRRVEARRQLTARGESELFLAAEQPEATEHVLPIAVSLRPKRLSITILSLLPALALFAGWIGYRVVIRPAAPFDGSLWPVAGIFLFVLLFMLVSLHALFSTEFAHSIEATDKGLRTRYKGQMSSISWEEARLFAFYGVFGDVPGDGTRTYELSGSKAVVKWTEYRRARRMRYVRPTVSFAEYRRQMSTLHEVIAARTGLPLYDLIR